MAKIINNGKWYTGDEYNEIYHDMILLIQNMKK